LRFVELDIKKHHDVVLKFRKDSFIVSFGDLGDFDEAGYLRWLERKSSQFPSGFQLIEENGEFVGQLECSILEYEDEDIGYGHLFYLI